VEKPISSQKDKEEKQESSQNENNNLKTKEILNLEELKGVQARGKRGWGKGRGDGGKGS
jgi:hypothetical protein